MQLTLPSFFALVVGLLAVIAGLTLILAVRTAGDAIVHTGETARQARAAEIASAVEADLDVAERAVEDFECALAAGIVESRDPRSVGRYLTAELLALRSLTDLTLTVGPLSGYDDDGQAVLAEDGRWQISHFRDGAGVLHQRLANAFVADGPGDPTVHDTFRGAAHRDSKDRALWSDLAYNELDIALPPESRRKTMSVQKAIFAGSSGDVRHFVGVLRAGIVSDTIDRLGAARPPDDPHQLFICDYAGRLVTRLAPTDPYLIVAEDGKPNPDGDLRVVPATIPAPVAAALAFARQGGRGGKRMMVGETPHLLTLAPLAEGRAQRWLVGIVVPESHYVGALAAARDRLLALLVVVVLAIGIVGFLGARTIGRGLRALVNSTEAMRRFSFEPVNGAASPFAEIRGAQQSVERAKTALRAMVKYVPVDLVRRLYDSGRDPVLGAEVTELTMMFTDIADFTTHAEALLPDQLAESLGRYLEAATRAVEGQQGTVDKYIGDALMVLWNAPEPVPDHPAQACRGALACAAATRALAASDWWQAAGLPPWRTRFGLHTDRVLLGNFGAPDRLSYTAMGDGVNLAARLEGLNKIYGTTILVSETVRVGAGDGFVFRQIDRVAVKGKTRGVAIFELIGEAGDPAVEARRPELARYEAALAASTERHFGRALELLASLASDPPARVLEQRCQAWSTDPPPAGWDGTWTATTK